MFIDSVKTGLIITLVVVLFGGGWQARGWFEADHELKVLKAISAAQEASANAAATEIAKIKIEHKEIYNKVVERTKTEIVYSECKHSDDTFQIIKGLFK